SLTQSYQPSPKGSSGRPAHCPFRGLLGVHSRYGLHTRAVTVYRDTLSEGFSHFVTSMTAPVASGAQEVAARYKNRFANLDLITINDFGGWGQAHKTHFAD